MDQGFDDRLTRTELITVLNDIGVSIPQDTKMSEATLAKRLRQALESMQLAQQHIAGLDAVDIPSLPIWHTDCPLFNAISRVNIDLCQTYVEGAGDVLYKNVVIDLRETFMSLGKIFDQGLRSAIVQTLDNTRCAVLVRIIGVHQLDAETPIVLLVFRVVKQTNSALAVNWVNKQPAAHVISATDAELKVLLKLLNINARRIPHEYKPSLALWEPGFKSSFLLPIGPLDFKDLARLNANFGCDVCGERTSKRCSQCQSVSYCSANCQKVDWADHKAFCSSLKGGTWIAVPFSVQLPGAENRQWSALINRHNTRPEDINVHFTKDNRSPPNIYGDKIFLVKLQIDLAGLSFLIYDRQRSFEAYVKRVDDPSWFFRVQMEMQGPRGGYKGLKMHRWAKRTGDFELTVCLDREPPNQIGIKW